MRRIKVAIAGVGNCASSLIQGIHYYRNSTSLPKTRMENTNLS